MNEEYLGMENNKSLFPLGFGYIPFKLDTIAEIISSTQTNKKEIKKEFRKLKSFYKENPEAFYYTLTSSKERLESKEDLSELELISLNEINKMLEDYEDIDKYFTFQEDFLLENYQKIYTQLSKLDRETIKKAELVDVIFYSLNTQLRENIPCGELYADGTINTGSRFQMEVFKVNPTAFVYLYQTLLN